MQGHDVFWKLEALSNQQLLERVGTILRSSHRLMAELIAHLGEVEERRLHLAAACSSMFAYCLKLGMTEDEAYRRIEVARLARRYPAIFPRLAAGQLTLSGVALLKHHLSDDNHLELLAAATGKTVVQTRELIAARFPRPDVSTSVRKLPERRTPMSQPSLTLPMPEEPRAAGMEPRAAGMEPRAGGTEATTGGTEPRFTSNVTESRTAGMDLRTGTTQTSHFERAAPPRLSSRIEPLSAQRYKVQFTASAELARKLELAKDLMRHSHPGGELGPIVERAMDLLIERLMQRRFGQGKKASPKRRRARSKPEPRADVMNGRFAMQDTTEPGIAAPAAATPVEPKCAKPAAAATPAEPKCAKPAAAATPAAAAEPATTTLADATAHDIKTHDAAATFDTPPTLEVADIEADCCAAGERASTPYIPRLIRRMVADRDGLGCSWVDEQGARCGSRAWLEYDHRRPRAKGGGSEPENLRLLCRNHNQFAAEQEYGRTHVEQTIAARRRERTPHAI